MKAWQNLLLYLEGQFSADIIKKWLRPLKIIKFDACNLYLQATNSFQITWFEEHIRPITKKCFFNNNHHPIKIHLRLANENTNSKKDYSQNTQLPPISISQDELYAHATMELFHASYKNDIPFTLLSELTGYNPKTKQKQTPTLELSSFNPLYIYGKEGVGKTHLLMACAKLLKDQGKKVFFVKAKTFTNHVVQAIRKANMDEFRKTYRNTDVLIIDDVHILSNKSATQEEFFHTFNTLHTNGSQIILSANASPSQLKAIEPRLISRFEWGITLYIEKLTKEDLRKVILNRCHYFHVSLKEEIIQFLITTFFTSTRSLHKAFEALILRTEVKAISTMNLSLAQETLKDLILDEQQNILTPEKIIHHVAEYFGITTSDILGKSQKKEATFPRQITMYLCRKKLQIPFKTIGNIFARDHSTVMTAIKQIESLLGKKEKNTAIACYEIEKKLEE